MDLRDDINCFEFTSHYALWHWHTPRPPPEVVAEFQGTFVNISESNTTIINGSNDNLYLKLGGADGARTPDPLRASRGNNFDHYNSLRVSSNNHDKQLLKSKQQENMPSTNQS